MNTIPFQDDIPIETLASIFNDTTNSYKYYWFLSILETLKHNDSEEIEIDHLCQLMLESVWYPLSYFKLSFGAQDQFKTIINQINLAIELEGTSSNIQQLNFKNEFLSLGSIRGEIQKLARWVPYRFLRPFFAEELRGLTDTMVNKAIVQLAKNTSERNPQLVPYHFVEGKIVLNRPWKDYLVRNMGLLKGFTYWHLAKFLQKNNPNVPGIYSKLFFPKERDLKLNQKCWKFYFNQLNGIQCIYSKKPIPENFSLDHFIPWSYAAHDLNWNILPISKEINSMKGNCLPSLDKYLADFVELQWDFILKIYDSNFHLKNKILEQYSVLIKDTATNIFNMPKDEFEKKLTETIQPMTQIALNMGFIKNWIYK